MRLIIFWLVLGWTGVLAAEVTQKIELRLVRSSSPSSVYAIDVVTTIAT
ncbi:MAG: hypothetical protein ACKO0N_05580 [Planctomycetota bacterium]